MATRSDFQQQSGSASGSLKSGVLTFGHDNFVINPSNVNTDTQEINNTSTDSKLNNKRGETAPCKIVVYGTITYILWTFAPMTLWSSFGQKGRG